MQRFGWPSVLLAIGLASACSVKAPQHEGAAPPSAPAVVWVRDVDHRRPLAAPAFSEPALAGDLIVIGGCFSV